MTTNRILRELRKEKGLSQAQAAQFLTENGFEVTQKSISNWERGETSPNADQFLLLCRLYDVRDVQQVFMDRPGRLSGLNAQGKKRVAEYIRLLEQDEAFSALPKPTPGLIRTLPLYDMPVSAGTGQFLDSDSYELIQADSAVPLSANFAVRISGDSMSPDFSDGQIIYVERRQAVEKGELGIFLLNGSAYFKQLSRGPGTALISFNKKYPPIPVSEFDELRVLGKVLA